jgi:hypothetical protein
MILFLRKKENKKKKSIINYIECRRTVQLHNLLLYFKIKDTLLSTFNGISLI